MEYRLNKSLLLDILRDWNRFIKVKVHLIACGGTAMTLQGVKYSTKDVDFMVPVKREYDYLVKVLGMIGYENITGSGWKKNGDNFIFDIFQGNRIHTTELLDSPLNAGGNIQLIEYSNIYVGILNNYDLISSKLMRGTSTDYEDCKELYRFNKPNIDINRLKDHYNEMVSYDVSEDRIRENIDIFISLLKEEGII